MLASLLCACALTRFGDTSPGANGDAADIEFLDRALDGTAATREAMWRDTAAEHGRDAALRLALLESVPEHGGYDPAAAQRSLRAVLAQNLTRQQAALARLRLDELKANGQCLSQMQDLRRRLAQVVDIERQIDGQGQTQGQAQEQAR